LERFIKLRIKMESMNDLVKKDIIAVLSRAVELLEESDEIDYVGMKELSNHTIHNSSIFQDPDSVSIAVLVYSISKIIERQAHVDEKIVGLLKNALRYLRENDVKSFEDSIKKSFEQISTVDSRLKMYIGEVIDQAQIKKGSKLFEHGISLARAAEIMGVLQWDLMGYVGQTRIIDNAPQQSDVISRLRYARKIFGV